MDSIVFIRIKELCTEKGITITKLESLMEMSQSTIGKWRTATPTVDKLMKVAQYFHVSLDYLVGQTDVASPEPTIRSACDLTGLSEQSVVNLSELNQAGDPNSKNKLTTIMQLIEDDGIEELGCDLLQSLTDYLFAKNIPKQPIHFTPQVSEYADILYNKLLTERVMQALQEARHQFQQPATIMELCGPIKEDVLKKREEGSMNGEPQDND